MTTDSVSTITDLPAPLGLFGGTFDPVHFGHLAPIKQAAVQTGIDCVLLIPCFVSPLKTSPKVSTVHRLAMLKLACQDEPLFEVDDRELKRQQPSYTVDTLLQLRSERPNTPLCFFMGMDSLVSLNNWHRWQDILKLCHIIVCRRSGYENHMPEVIKALISKHQTNDNKDLSNALAGHIFIAETDMLNISATDIRRKLAKGETLQTLLPPSVIAYIQQHKLYSTSFC